ncbi:MAG TPA: amino acid ABC transporter permease [Thermomicrobiales bacterium]|nr:amino acid ABC transporter permease [Thermomicrobiales bacterium]
MAHLFGTLPLLIGLRLPYQLRWEYVTNNIDWFIDGLKVALWMSLIGLLIGSIIGLACAFVRSSGRRPFTWLITAYVEIVRNVPLLLIVFVFYFGLPQAFPRGSEERDFILRALPTPERTFTVALSIYAGAYLTEIFSSGIISVSRRYLDAGRSLGLSRWQMARYVTGPIMFRTVLPSLSNTFISLFKDSGVAFFIGVREVSFAANKVNTDFFRPIEGWLAAGLLYLITAWLIAVTLRFLEGRIKWSV